MRYVPNLIPKSAKVLPHYFKGSPYKNPKPAPVATLLNWIGGMLCVLLALVSLPHLPAALLFGMAGLVLLPPGRQWLQNKLRFRLESKPKVFLAGILLLFAFPLFGYYQNADSALAAQAQLAASRQKEKQAVLDKQTEVERAIAAQKAQQQHDSLNLYLEAARKAQKAHKAEGVEKNLATALAFATTAADQRTIAEIKSEFAAQNTFELVKGGKYKAALPQIEELISRQGTTPELLYNRALCYSKTGKEAEAVADCKMAMERGSKEAEKLHEKINPIQKHVTGYVIRCCDGTISYSTSRRGTCSHHGGVCDWKEPIYEEYRKYE